MWGAELFANWLVAGIILSFFRLDLSGLLGLLGADWGRGRGGDWGGKDGNWVRLDWGGRNRRRPRPGGGPLRCGYGSETGFGGVVGLGLGFAFGLVFLEFGEDGGVVAEEAGFIAAPALGAFGAVEQKAGDGGGVAGDALAVEFGTVDSVEAGDAPFGVDHEVYEGAFIGVGGLEFVVEDGAEFFEFFGIFLGEEGVAGEDAVFVGVLGGGGFSFGSAGAGGELGVGSVGCEAGGRGWFGFGHGGSFRYQGYHAMAGDLCPKFQKRAGIAGKAVEFFFSRDVIV